MLEISTYRELKKGVSILENSEKMLPIPQSFLHFTPHPYLSVGATYDGLSPFYLRESVISRLIEAQEYLQSIKKGYRLKIFDAYRPLSVQRYMIEYDKNRIAKEIYNLSYTQLSTQQKDDVAKKVLLFWSPVFSDAIKNPPPHSTGGALDLTLCDEECNELDMGTDIDALVKESFSDFYNNTKMLYDKNRTLLKEVMEYAGFTQLPTEWWHYSYGDQIWALDNNRNAMYGVYESEELP